ncbi:peroxisomal sarcosine oxidase [Plakobranchus ocellatus]|uniref:Peroxisomal sarcosine oxidase n=1 Tax=Plakobranchus ocellatus TaxID=259542 RepID=A0AAV3ZEU8_9GAST|nr:peroxisomal sarcosine oxidase [Plakobranchus ocellatus]
MASSRALYDVIVIGAGIEGSSCAYNLAKEGEKVLLIEQPNPSGSCRIAKGKGQAEMSIATFNTRTIRHQDDLERLLEELEQIKWHIIGLSEAKRRGE